MPSRHCASSARSVIDGGKACQKSKQGFLTVSPGQAESAVGILFVSQVGTERPTDQGSNRAKRGAD